MRLVFLGGAETIGASATLLEIDGRRLLVDCGVRLRGTGSERLPDLSRLEELGPPSAVLVTHGHLDHIGALPVLHQRYPATPVYATPPTIDLTRIQLLDSLRILREEASADGEVPLYSEATVESLLRVMVPVTPLRALRPGLGDDGGPEVTFFPAGHIIGASSLGISGTEGRVFLSGDISVDNQRTIPGMRSPDFRADVAVFESTYGNRLHAPRAQEESRLVAAVAERIALGGKVLIPAFAIGRAQEVLLILMRAQLAGEIPEFPIVVDGMVRRTCSIYASHPRFVQSTLRRRAEKHGDPFFGVLEGVRPVRDPSEREAVLAGGPCAIISSSGMLHGGPSQIYAARLASDPESLITITGYQDEEAPGRELLEAAEGRRETVRLGGAEVPVRCRITSYALSGHASGAQIAQIARGLRPRQVFLVHGDARARHDLADLFVRERIGRVALPAHGEVYELEPPAGRGPTARGAEAGAGAETARRPPSRRRLHVTGLGRDRGGGPPAAGDLEDLAKHLRDSYRPGATFTIEELFVIWRGREPGAGEDEELEEFERRVRESPAIEAHATRLFEFRAADPECRSAGAGGWNPQEVAARLDAVLPADSGLLAKSYAPGATHMTLVFPFPEVARERFAGLLATFFAEVGWSYDLHPEPNLNALDRAVRSLVPDPRLLSRNPSILTAERRLTVWLSRALEGEEIPAWEAAAARLARDTGFQAELRAVPRVQPAKRSMDEAGRLEINLAYELLRDAFAGEPDRPARIGKKQAPGGEEHIEIAFISPEVGARYTEKLRDLERSVGRTLRVSPAADLNGIIEAARRLIGLPRIRKGPSFLPASRSVRVAVREPIPFAEAESLAAEFESRTGLRLVIEHGAGGA
jgi:Cft2 family RNA processing exonuclease